MPSKVRAKATAKIHNVIRIAIGELKKQKRRRRRRTGGSTRSKGFNQSVAEEVQRQISAMPQTGHLRQSAEPGHNLFSKLAEMKKKENDAEATRQRQNIEELGRQTRAENERLARELRWEAHGRQDAERIHTHTQMDRLNDRAVKLSDALGNRKNPLMTSIKPEKTPNTLTSYFKPVSGTPVGPIKEGEEKKDSDSDIDPDDVNWQGGGGLFTPPRPSKGLLSRLGFSSGKKPPTAPDSPLPGETSPRTQVSTANLTKGQILELANKLAITIPDVYVNNKGKPTNVSLENYRKLITDSGVSTLALRDAIKEVKTGRSTPSK